MRIKKALNDDLQTDHEIEKSITKFSQHLMSNSKWVKLIDALIDHAAYLKLIGFKKVQNSDVGKLYLSEDTLCGYDFWEVGFEGHNSLGGWLTFKEIEYLVFPKIVTSENDVQDLNQIKSIIEKVGQFDIEMNDDGLKMNCYKI